MSGLSRMGQNCFGVGTPILSPRPPAGSTAATAGAQRWSWASAPLGGEAEAFGPAPRTPRGRGPGSAGPEPPGRPGSMAARPAPLAPAPAGLARRVEGGRRQGCRARRQRPPGRSGPACCGSPGNAPASDLSSRRVCGLCTEPSAPGRAVSQLVASPLAGPASAAGGSVSPPHIPQGPLKLRSCEVQDSLLSTSP